MSDITLTLERSIAAPPTAVWSVLTDIERSATVLSGVTRVERLAGVEAGGRRHDPGGGLPRQEGDERQDLRTLAGLPLSTPAHGPSLSLPTHLDRQRDGGRVAGLPPTVRPGSRGAAHRELAQHLGQRERSAVGLRAQHRGEPRVAHESGERGVGEGTHRDVNDGAGGADGGQCGGRGGIGDTPCCRARLREPALRLAGGPCHAVVRGRQGPARARPRPGPSCARRASTPSPRPRPR